MSVKAARWLSFLWPIRERRVASAQGTLDLTWVNGELVVSTAHADQSYGSLHRVWRSAFRDAELGRKPPVRMLVLGFGAGSIARIVHTEMRLPTHITGVDHDPAMLDLAQETYGIRPSDRLELVLSDAIAFAQRNGPSFDLISVDLFKDADLAPGIDTPEALRAMRGCLAPGGTLLFNTIAHDAGSAARSERLAASARLVFDAVEARRYEGSNLVYTCR